MKIRFDPTVLEATLPACFSGSVSDGMIDYLGRLTVQRANPAGESWIEAGGKRTAVQILERQENGQLVMLITLLRRDT